MRKNKFYNTEEKTEEKKLTRMELDIKKVDLFTFNILTRKFEEIKEVQLNISENEKNEKIYKFKGNQNFIVNIYSEIKRLK